MTASTRGRICMHVPRLYAAIAGADQGFAGGAELQVATIARGLAARGFDVSVVSIDVGQPDRERRDGITHLKSFRDGAGLPGVRFFVPRMTQTVRALRSARADVYYIRGAGVMCGITYDVARSMSARFVLAAAHDLDMEASLPFVPRPWEKWWHRRAIAGADLRIAQTRHQQRRWQEVFGVPSELVPNLVELPALTGDPGRDGAVVWLGTYKDAKRPEWFTALAGRCPATRFVMCGVIPPAPLDDRVWRAARAAAETTANLEVRPHVEHARLSELFEQASLFVHTAPAEGMPNTLLEAWAHGVPTVSAVDPDGVVEKAGLGRVATSLDRMAQAVAELLNDPEGRREAGRRARSWVESHHAPEPLIDRFAALLDPLVATRRASPPA